MRHTFCHCASQLLGDSKRILELRNSGIDLIVTDLSFTIPLSSHHPAAPSLPQQPFPSPLHLLSNKPGLLLHAAWEPPMEALRAQDSLLALTSGA